VARAQASGRASRRFIFLCGAIPALIAALLALYRPESFSFLENRVYDALLKLSGARPPANRVVIVDVDERSLSAVGQWPWRREVLGQLISALRREGAATIALDIIFAEPDRFERTAGLDAAAERERSGTPTPDELFAETLREGGVVLGYAFTFDGSASLSNGCVLHPLGLAVVRSEGYAAEDLPLFEGTGVVCSLPGLARAAGGSGFLNAAPDSDGILRRVPLLIQAEDRVYPALSLAAVAATLGAKDAALRMANMNSSSLVLEDREMPLDGRGNLLLRYRGPKRTFPYVSAADVLDGRVPPGTLRDKIAFVGTTALGTREVVATPLDRLFAGVEVHATLADNLLQQDFIRRPPGGAALESLAASVLGLATAAIVAGSGMAFGILAAALAVAAAWWASLWWLNTSGVFSSPLFPSLGIAVGLAGMTLGKFMVERRRADTEVEEKATAQRLMVQTLLSLTETRDAETGRHSRRTRQYARMLAQELARHPRFHEYLTPERIDLLSSLAPLHDIGKVGVPDAILNKPGALTADELAQMRRHPIYGRDVIVKAERQAGVTDDEILSLAKEIVYTHHERWDGTGYPQGLSGPDIPVAGRIMAIVDVYDAAVMRALYRPPMSHESAVEFIRSSRGTHFDPAVVDAFLRVAPAFENVAREAGAFRSNVG
jgi:adenylate cyclase